MRTTRSGESLLLLLDVIELLGKRKVPYAVIGAVAASLYCAVRASMDADLILSSGASEASTLEQDLRTAGFQTQLTRGELDDPVTGLLRVSDGYGNQVALLLGLRGLDCDAFSRVVEAPFQEKNVRFIGREDFIAMKVFAGGPLDLLDAARAMDAAGKAFDEGLGRGLARQYGQHALEAFDPLLADRSRS